MLTKALVFGDEQQGNLIVETTDPVEQKRLGSNIKGFEAAHWGNKMEDAMEKAIQAKFTQNQESSFFLLNTGVVDMGSRQGMV